MANDLIMRYQWEAYMGCLGDSETEVFNLIGEGFTSFPEKKNPQEYTRKYINYKTEKTDVIGYAPSITYSADCVSDDPVVQEVVTIHETEAVGTATHRNIVSVNRWKETAGKCDATMRTYAIIPDEKGSGTEALIYTGTMKAVSDIIPGTFDVKTKTFTAATTTNATTTSNSEDNG